MMRRLGNSGIKVSELCLGTMTFGRETDEKTSKEIISRFLDKDGNFIDTADVYGATIGASEEIIGRALKDKRDKIILATKVGFGSKPNDEGLSRLHIIQALERSLRRLQTDYVDLYYLHVWDSVTPLEETLSTLDTLLKMGKIRYIGVSNFTAWQIMKALAISDQNSWSRFVCYQPQYSLLLREIEKEFIPLCQCEGLGIVAWAPLAGGFLSGKYNQNVVVSSKDNRLFRVKEEDADSAKRRFSERNFRILDVVKKIAGERGKSCSQIALKWIQMQPGITGPVIGARTTEQIEDNLGCIGWELAEEEIKELNEVSEIVWNYPYDFIRKETRR